MSKEDPRPFTTMKSLPERVVEAAILAFMRRCKEESAARRARGEYDDVKIKAPGQLRELVPDRARLKS